MAYLLLLFKKAITSACLTDHIKDMPEDYALRIFEMLFSFTLVLMTDILTSYI